MTDTGMPQQPTLARRIGTPLLVLYGLGTILGAGIYVLVGKVAGVAGMLAPLSFIVAAIIAWLTAQSYSILVVLFPKSAGESVYVEQAFQQRWLTFLVGGLIVLTGIVSAATLTNGFTGYFVRLVPINETAAMLIMLLLITALALWGIAESLSAAALITLIEVLGLLLVLFYCGDAFQQLPQRADELLLPASGIQLAGVLSGAFLAFYAFIGFEDMVNVVEEVKEPQHTMPRAIIWVVILSTSLYVLIALVALLAMPLTELVASKAPLAELLQSKNAVAAQWLSVISVFAIVNGVLIQLIMASRVCYGMAKRYHGPRWIYYVSPLTRTPVYATVMIAVVVLLFALFLPLVVLARFTSFIILIIFMLINFALWKMQRDHYVQANPEQLAHVQHLRSYPLLAGLCCLGLLLFQITQVII